MTNALPIKKALLVSDDRLVWLSGNILALSSSIGVSLRNLLFCSTTCLNLLGVGAPKE